MPNPTQLDADHADHDGYGDACSSDFNEDDVLIFVDLAILQSFFFMPPWPSDVERATRVPFVSNEERLAFIERAVRGVERPSTEGDC